MSKILRLDRSYDLWLTYTWSGNNHGVCGHTFEVVDYFHILRQQFKVGILLAEDIDWVTFEACIRNKYDFTEDEIQEIKQNTIFCNRPSLVTGRNILFTDGGVTNLESITLIFDHVLHFACGRREIKHNTDPKTYVLQDDRVYEPVAVNGINYKKRILFDRLKNISCSTDGTLIYATASCRDVSDFSEFSQYGENIIAIVNKINKPRVQIPGITFIEPPVTDLFSRFSTYVYTPVQRKWDCSPRFIAECAFYGKNVVYHNIDYWDVDHGLYWRKWDIDNDFDSLHLRSNDEIFTIVRNIIC